MRLHREIKNNQGAVKFMNSIRIRIESDMLVESKTVFLTLKGIIDSSIKDILTLMQYKSNKIWIIQFNKNFDIQTIVGKDVLISNTKCTIHNASELDKRSVYLIDVLRVHWFPINFHASKIEDHLKSGISKIEILFRQAEHFKDAEMRHVSNRINRIKIKYPIESHESVLNMTEINDIDNRTLIQLSGHAPKCLFCSKFGPTIPNCELKKLKCTSCGNHGHTVDSCKKLFNSDNFPSHE